MEKEETRSGRDNIRKVEEKTPGTLSRVYDKSDELIANESSLEEMERFMEKNEDLITAGQVFTAWSKEQMWKMLDAKKD